MLVRVRERNDRLQASVQQVTLVQAADGSISHERFEIPPWLSQALAGASGVSVAGVSHNDGKSVKETPASGSVGGITQGSPGGAPPVTGVTATVDPPPSKEALRFYLHESENEESDRERLDRLIQLLRDHPGDDPVRLFIHARDGDRIELTLPDASSTDDLRLAGVDILGPQGGAEPVSPVIVRTRGVEPVEV
jgi:hypothetical protein